MKPHLIILDNGASSIKAGIPYGGSKKSASNGTTGMRLVPNAIVRSKGDKATYFGHELDDCRDYSSLHYRLPFEKGYLVDWDAQKAIWDGVFSDRVLGVNTTESALILTEPYFNLPNIQEVYDQFVFEEYEFLSYHRCTPASLIPHGKLFDEPNMPPPECMTVIDSGFSFTHVVPLLNGNVVWSAVKRLDVGGKLLTNQLKELVSFRQWNMMDETYIMNEVKESCCYVSTDFKRDIETVRLDLPDSNIVQRYVLPDMSANRRGRILGPDEMILESEQVLVMKNERFSVPEIVFRPDDIGEFYKRSNFTTLELTRYPGLDQSGLASAIAGSIACLPVDLQDMFWANIGLIGGNTKFPGFQQRLMSELQSLAPSGCEVAIYECADPIAEAYLSASHFASKPDFPSRCVTRAEYMESGSNASRRKFRDWKTQTEREKANDAKSRDDRSQSAHKLSKARSRTNLQSAALKNRQGR